MGMVIKEEILNYSVSKILDSNLNFKLEEIYFILTIMEKEFYKIYKKRITNIPITYYKTLDTNHLNKILSNSTYVFKEISIIKRSLDISAIKMYYIYFHNRIDKYNKLPEDTPIFLTLEEFIFLREYLDIFLKDLEVEGLEVYRTLYDSYITNVLGELSSFNNIINETEDFIDMDIILNYDLLVDKLKG